MASQASSDKKSQREIADIAGVADVTIRQSYKLMLPRAAELFPDGFNFASKRKKDLDKYVTNESGPLNYSSCLLVFLFLIGEFLDVLLNFILIYKKLG